MRCASIRTKYGKKLRFYFDVSLYKKNMNEKGQYHFVNISFFDYFKVKRKKSSYFSVSNFLKNTIFRKLTEEQKGSSYFYSLYITVFFWIFLNALFQEIYKRAKKRFNSFQKSLTARKPQYYFPPLYTFSRDVPLHSCCSDFLHKREIFWYIIPKI